MISYHGCGARGATLSDVKLTGDPDAIAALKAMHTNNPGYMKALLEDVKTTTDRTTTFRDEAGVKYRMTLDQNTGELRLDKA